MRSLRRILGRATLLLLLGAGLYLYAAHEAGREELRELCRQGVEPRVYRRVSAEGYFDSGISCLRNGCWDVLMKSGFRYIEVEQRDAQPWKALSENGFYRLSRVPVGSGLCDAKILDEMKRAVLFRKFVAEGYCIRKEQIEEPTAIYGVFSEPLEPVRIASIFRSVIDVRRFFIVELKSEDVIAERNNYVLYQRSLPVFSSFPAGLGCPDVGINPTLPNIGIVEFYLGPS